MNFTWQSLAFIEGVGGSELLLIMFIVLLLFGGDKLPGVAKGMGKAVREFKKAASSIEEEFKRAMDEEPTQPAAKPLPTTFPPRPPERVVQDPPRPPEPAAPPPAAPPTP